ncbi:hypothetical protein PL321_00585 [Caloramator sp. mosi_1]|nr:hypothetical protein [Caloramator sp. mosi_1]WDC84370.1 hypothetical protein PL321_00585 [Caloramator sp. mosi_1]
MKGKFLKSALFYIGIVLIVLFMVIPVYILLEFPLQFHQKY